MSLVIVINLTSKTLNMKFRFFLIISLLLITINCAVNPFTGKKTMAFVPDSKLIPMAYSQYDEVLSESEVLKDTEESEMIKRVGERIKLAARKYLKYKGMDDYDANYDWEFNLIESEQINAWAMPGGKVAFYTGILSIAENEDGVAAIMGHEIVHALANHGQQRMSAGLIQQGAAVVGNVALSEKEEQQQIFNVAFGVGSQVFGMLPFSRKHETEADEQGLVLMILAGYDPEEAPKLWERMKTASNGQSPPEFLSTHPSHDTRIENLRNRIPTARAEAEKIGIINFN